MGDECGNDEQSQNMFLIVVTDPVSQLVLLWLNGVPLNMPFMFSTFLITMNKPEVMCCPVGDNCYLLKNVAITLVSFRTVAIVDCPLEKIPTMLCS